VPPTIYNIMDQINKRKETFQFKALEKCFHCYPKLMCIDHIDRKAQGNKECDMAFLSVRYRKFTG